MSLTFKTLKKIDFIIITPIFILLSHYLAVFLHEYAHTFVAFFLGDKQNPFDLHYGGKSVLNLLLLSNVDQNVDYQILYAMGHTVQVALIAAAGPLMNLLLFFFAYWLLKSRKTIRRPYRYYFILLFALMNLGNIYGYIPIRVFVTHGTLVDIVEVEKALHLSPWEVYIFLGYGVIYMAWLFFGQMLRAAYSHLGLTETKLKASLMIVCVFIFFGYFGLPGFFSHEVIPYFMAVTSMALIPVMIVILWPSKGKIIKSI